MSFAIPRCGLCRVAIESDQNVVFRPDGRVQHAHCPPVTCSLCSREILPADPISRQGDAMFHGACWMKRIRRRTPS